MSKDPKETASLTASDGGRAHDEGLLLVAGGDRLLTFPLRRDEIVIGRAPDCDVVLEHEALSRRHVRLRLGTAITVEDLGSRNGTRLRGERVAAGEHTLGLGEPFQIGRFHFLVARARRQPTNATTSIRTGSLRVIDPTPTAASSFLRNLATSPLSILILGETGVGKEILAQTIHELSCRKGAFVRANPAAIETSLAEAGGGTLFLDEVGEISLEIQATLLHAIEAPTKLDVRIVAATNRDLATEVTAGHFRSDLFFRLDGATLIVPPLRERPERIAPLARQFLATSGKDLDADVLARLEAHAWPGNVRELKAVLERAAILAGAQKLEPRHLAISPLAGKTSAMPVAATPAEAAERERIIEALDACAGNQTRAAKLLGISRATLVTKLTFHRIQRPRK
ncbi:MAG TPA: sigma 54-interacting transcriptional regulator [Kofleriaceae bacterium]